MEIQITSWAGVDPVCEVCGEPAVWFARLKTTGEIMAAACQQHKAMVQSALVLASQIADYQHEARN